MSTAPDILNNAANLIGGDRANQHGDLQKTHETVAEFWGDYLSAKLEATVFIDPWDVAQMMTLLKIGRALQNPLNEDNYTDGAGYQAVAGQLRIGAAKRETNAAE